MHTYFSFFYFFSLSWHYRKISVQGLFLNRHVYFRNLHYPTCMVIPDNSFEKDTPNFLCTLFISTSKSLRATPPNQNQIQALYSCWFVLILGHAKTGEPMPYLNWTGLAQPPLSCFDSSQAFIQHFQMNLFPTLQPISPQLKRGKPLAAVSIFLWQVF